MGRLLEALLDMLADALIPRPAPQPVRIGVKARKPGPTPTSLRQY